MSQSNAPRVKTCIANREQPQGHDRTRHELDRAIVDYASLGLKVSITELDVTIRGASGGQFGRGFGREPLPLDANSNPKPAYAAIVNDPGRPR